MFVLKTNNIRETRKDNPETLATLGHKSQNEDKKSKKHNTEHMKGKQFFIYKTPAVLFIVKFGKSLVGDRGMNKTS